MSELITKLIESVPSEKEGKALKRQAAKFIFKGLSDLEEIQRYYGKKMVIDSYLLYMNSHRYLSPPSSRENGPGHLVYSLTGKQVEYSKYIRVGFDDVSSIEARMRIGVLTLGLGSDYKDVSRFTLFYPTSPSVAEISVKLDTPSYANIFEAQFEKLTVLEKMICFGMMANSVLNVVNRSKKHW